MTSHPTPHDPTDRDEFERLEDYEARLRQIKANIPENPFANSSLPLPAEKKVKNPPPTDREDSARAAFESSQAIGHGFEIYAQVLTGALMIAIPAVGGYFLDQYLNVMFFAPAGGVIGMISGLSYLLKITQKPPRRQK